MKWFFLLPSSEFKDCLIFGPSCASSRNPSPLLDALTLSRNSPRFFSTCSSSHEFASATSTLRDSSQHSQQQQLSSWLIDPNYPRRKINLHHSKFAPAMAVISDFSHRTVKRPLFGHKFIVHAIIFLVLYLALGVVIYCFTRHSFAFTATETHPIADALYFCIVTMCTIGYGDITPNSTGTKIFSIFFVFGYAFVDILLLSGMITHVLEFLENHLLRAVEKGRKRIGMKVALALGVVVLCIGVGVMVMHFVESLGWVDSFYLSVMSVTTVGYGDQAFKTKHGRFFAAIWLLVSTYAVARAFLYLAEARVDMQHWRMEKRILDQNMTFTEFLAADIDNDGFVSKSEYVVYMLKEMGKVREEDIMQISEKFDRLYTGNIGKITLGHLIKGHNG